MCAQGADDVVFQNTAYLVTLAAAFPLHVFVLSKIVQFYASKTMRASVIEDLGSTWYKRQIGLLPMPGEVSVDWIQELRDKGDALIQADRLLADKYRDIQGLLEKLPSQSLNERFLQGHPMTNGVNLSEVPEEEIAITRVELQGEDIVVDDMFWKLTVPDKALREYLYYTLRRGVDENNVDITNRQGLAKMQVPDDVEKVVEAYRELESQDLQANFNTAHNELDHFVGTALGLSSAQCDYIIASMTHARSCVRSSPCTNTVGCAYSRMRIIAGRAATTGARPGGTPSGAAQALVKGIRGYRARRESQAKSECSEIRRKAYSTHNHSKLSQCVAALLCIPALIASRVSLA